MSTIAAILGRLLLALLFVLAGLNKLMDPAGTTEYIVSATTLPGSLAVPTGLFELIAGVFLALGFMTRFVAILLAGFSLLTILFFHNDLGDPAQQVLTLKNLAITGGLLVVFAYGQMRGTFDHIRTARKGEVATHEADQHAHDAELRAARAEGKAEGLAQRDG